MNLPRNVVGVLREDAVSLEACHDDFTARAGEGGKETQLSAVTRGASVMSAPSRFHLQHKPPQPLLDTALSFITWEFGASTGIPQPCRQRCQMLPVRDPGTNPDPWTPPTAGLGEAVPVPRLCPAAATGDSSRHRLRDALGCSGSSATPPSLSGGGMILQCLVPAGYRLFPSPAPHGHVALQLLGFPLPS